MNIYDKLTSVGIDLHKTGYTTCPKCSDLRKKSNDKCLHVEFTDTGAVYRCNHCTWQGGFYNDKYSEPVKKKYRRPEADVIIESAHNESMYKFFDTRGITREVVDFYDMKLNNRQEICMPMYKDGELINIKYRGRGKTFRNEKNTMPILFGMKQVDEFLGDGTPTSLVWCEGEIDAMSYMQVGIPAISVPNGASSSKMEYIENCYEWIGKFKTHYIATDNDDPGEALKQNLIVRLGKENCKIVDFSIYGVKDANELMVRNPDKLGETIMCAESLPIDRVVTYTDIKSKIFDLHNGKFNEGFSSGFSVLDDLYKIKTGKLMIVTGYPSRGKSFFSDNVLLNLTEDYGWKHFICSFENSPANHFTRLASMRTGKSFFGEDGKKISDDEIKDQIDFLTDHFFFSDNSELWTVDQIIQKATELVRHRGVKTITIDPYNRLSRNMTDREDRYIGELLSKLSAFAKREDVLVIFIAHPKKPMQGNSAPPTMYDISGSPDWYNMADYGIIIHRDRNEDNELSKTTKVIVAKVKDVELGDPSGGTRELEFINWRFNHRNKIEKK